MTKVLLRILLPAVLIAAIVAAIVNRDTLGTEVLQQWVNESGAAGPLVFILAYGMGTLLFLPGSVITLAGGALFGPVWGTFYNLAGATLGATLAFLAARYLAGNWVEQKVGGRLKQLKNGVEAEGWRFVAFTRLVPLFPFNALNYALGLTRIALPHYVIASALAMIPGAIAYTCLGYVGREAAAGSEGVIQKSLLGLALLALVAFLPRLIGRLRQGPTMTVAELRARLAADGRPLVLDVRSPEEFEGELGHIEGALNLPLEQLQRRLAELEPFLERTIAIVCLTDRRSAKAAQILARHGYADVHVVRGGMSAWNKAGYSKA